MRHTTCARALIAGACFAAPAMAQDRTVVSDPVSIAAASSPVFPDGRALAEADLGAIAGREDHGTQIAAADQRNTISNNSVTGNSVTGSVTIDGQAFSNLSGLAIISANSGNNVAINSAMNVVINLAPQ